LYRCHGKGGFNYALDRRLLERRKVVPGNPAKSRLYRLLANEDMPRPRREATPQRRRGRPRQALDRAGGTRLQPAL